MKLTLAITPPVFDAIVGEAAINGIRVSGHVDPRVGVMRALVAGQHIEHLDNYLESVLADSAPMRGSVSDIGVFKPANWESLDYVDDAKVARIAGATARARVFTSPTLTLFKQAFGLGQPDSEIRTRPDWAMMPVKMRELYLKANAKHWGKPPSEARRQRWIEVRNRLVRTIADSGGKIMAGSDTPEWFMGYGFTLHRELENLVAAGLTPHEALAAATRNPAEFLHALSEWGTIEPYRRAASARARCSVLVSRVNGLGVTITDPLLTIRFQVPTTCPPRIIVGAMPCPASARFACSGLSTALRSR